MFCAGYYLVLRRLTFYNLNRIYLIGAILFASIYPMMNLDGFAGNHPQLVQPIKTVISTLKTPAESLVVPLNKHDYWQWAQALFFAGSAFLTIRLLLQFFSLYRTYRRSNSGEINGYAVRIITGTKGPFSFWRNIYVNPARHQPDELLPILQHEKIHADQLHSLDILLAELSIIFYWYNPGIWLMRKAVHDNIEFITDQKILDKGTDSRKYQYSLLNVSVAATSYGIVSNFNLSTLKKRILMMNAARSSRLNLTRYALLIPVLLIVLCAFTISKTNPFSLVKGTYHTIASTPDVPKLQTEVKEKSKANAFIEQKNLFHKVNQAAVDTLMQIRQQPSDTAKIDEGAKVKEFVVFANKSALNAGRATFTYDSVKTIEARLVAVPVKDSTHTGVSGKVTIRPTQTTPADGEKPRTFGRGGGGFGGMGGRMIRVSPPPSESVVKPVNP